jgi:hypothetical protein
MNTLEREVVEKFYQLDSDAQKRVRELIVHQTASIEQPDTSAFDYETWFREVESLRKEVQATHGSKQPDVVGILRDIRDGEDE